MAVQEVDRVELVVDELADRVAVLDAVAVGLHLPLLLGERREVDAEAAHPPVGRVVLGSRARHRHPERRVGVLDRLGQDGPGRHREELALVAVALLGPHLGQGVDELVPRLLRVVRVGLEAAQLGPRGRPAGPHLQPTARQDVEHRGPLGDADRVVELGHAGDDPVADPHPLGLHGAGRQEQLRGPSSGSTPRGSGARPPRPDRSRAGRPARPARASARRPTARSRRTVVARTARRRSRISWVVPPGRTGPAALATGATNRRPGPLGAVTDAGTPSPTGGSEDPTGQACSILRTSGRGWAT